MTDSNIIPGYKLISILGEGTFGKVYDVIKLDTNKKVAIKI